MATKQCNQCGKSKPLSEYHKKTASKDGKQDKCKACFKIVNKNFRETKPKYQVDWQRKNAKYWCDYMCGWKRADKNGLIYKITAPDGMIYVGQTKTRLGVRFAYHKAHYKGRYQKMPGLHASFDKWGIENHKFELLKDFGNIDRKELLKKEKEYIQYYKGLGLSLNIN